MKQKNEPLDLYMDDSLPFGKYKGKTLSEVMYEDQSYADWLDNNIDNYHFNWNTNKKWCEIMDKGDVAPVDGLYIIACRGDMHEVYEVYRLTKGDRFWSYYEGDNVHYNGWAAVDCVAYCCVDQFGEHFPQGDDQQETIKWKAGCLVFCDFIDEIGQLKQTLLFDDPFNGLISLEGVTIRSYRYIPYYTPKMLIDHFDLWELRHSEQTRK